jgi:hypothetical protein
MKSTFSVYTLNRISGNEFQTKPEYYGNNLFAAVIAVILARKTSDDVNFVWRRNEFDR